MSSPPWSRRPLSRRTALAGLVASAGSTWAAPTAKPPVSAGLPPVVHKLLRGSGLPLGSFGLEVRAVDEQQPLLSFQADQALVLASTAKLITGLAALDLLGPDYQWVTLAYATGPIEKGNLAGDLLLVGGGDPSLSSAQLRAWMVEMRKAGLDNIRGNIVLDRSAFDLHEKDHATTPEPGPDRPHHVRPDALIVDEGTLQLSVRSARSGMANVQTSATLGGVKLVNAIEPGAGCDVQANWEDAKPQARLRVTGSWKASCETRHLAFVPPADAGVANQQLAALWRSVGGRLQGRVRESHLKRYQQDGLRLPLVNAAGEPIQPWMSLPSRPLREVLMDINKSSNNLASRHVMLSLAPGFPQRPATLAGAQARVQGWLQRQGFEAGDLSIDNGSGLSRAERGRPRALVQLLCKAIHQRDAQAFLESLPVAGVDGTLAHRMERGFAAGMAFLKTGSLLDARALAGYVRGRSGKVYAVATLVNHPDAAAGRPALDGVIEWLARTG